MSTAKELVKTDRAIWVVADTHFRHADALAWYGRPQATVDAMDDALVDAINARVGAKDLLVHLGDFARRAARPSRGGAGLPPSAALARR